MVLQTSTSYTIVLGYARGSLGKLDNRERMRALETEMIKTKYYINNIKHPTVTKLQKVGLYTN